MSTGLQSQDPEFLRNLKIAVNEVIQREVDKIIEAHCEAATKEIKAKAKSLLIEAGSWVMTHATIQNFGRDTQLVIQLGDNFKEEPTK